MGWGGQEIRILRESAGMRQRGHNVIIAAHPESGLFARAVKDGLETVPVKFRRRDLFRIIPFFKKLIEEKKIDIVNTHSSKDSWLVLPAARLARNRPLVIRTRHLSTPVHRGIANMFLYNYLPHFVITTGKAIREQLININGFNADRIVSIPTGVDTDAFDPQKVRGDLRKELSLAQETPLIGMVSVLRSWKGHIHFINSIPYIIRKRPDARFIIAGEGPHRRSIEKTIDEVDARGCLYLLGHRDDISNVMSSLDILVHPSYANEGVPQSVLQAMAMRIPVIASDLAPLKEVVRDGITGLITPVNDPEKLAAGILKLLENKELASGMAETAKKLIEKEYSFNTMLDSTEALYSGKR
ncbi:MAG: glycosyltransferase family 4 protein [Nitrospirota bacterium]|nr:glycosyltransferase family 4 protein [Nitrospirota bacterium]